MKEFFLVRHAKSSWDEPNLSDKERPLNNRGKKDAPFMAKYALDSGHKLTHIISSPARRAFTTAQAFGEVYSEMLVEINIETELYFGSEEEWLDLIVSQDESVSFPAYFSHNPTITSFANMFQHNVISNVPTCGIIHLESTVMKWNEVSMENTVVKNIYTPKGIRNQ